MALVLRMDNWLDVATYAQACGVTNRAISQRIRRGVITHTVIDEVRLIDAEASPPEANLYASAPKAPSWQWPEAMPPKNELV
jgi:hypothetical protein